MSIKLPGVVNSSSNIPVNIKFKCNMCNLSFKKNITLAKHKNIKQIKNNSTFTSKIQKGQFGFAFEVRPGKETEAEELRSEWKEKKKDDNMSNEKEQNIKNDF